MTAAEIAGAVRNGERSARSVVDEHLATIDARNPELNAMLLVTHEQARQHADEIDAAVARGEDPGPLAGVPVALKDNLCTQDTTTTCASRMLEHWKPPYDAFVVKRLRDAGAVMVGKANLDEFAMGGSTENSAFGVARNPHDTSRVSGGSSGGSAAAVAAGFAPIALGSDTGGSVRQPASYCGVVGMKPTYGLVSRNGLVAFASSLDQIGPFGVTVEDAALCLTAIAGHDPGDSTSINQELPDYTATLHNGVEGMRIGMIRELTGDGIGSDVGRNFNVAMDTLRQNGAIVEEVSVEAIKYTLSAYYLIAPAEASSNLARYDGMRFGLREEGADIFETFSKTRSAGFGDEVKRRIMLGTYALSAGYYDAYYGTAQRVRTLVTREFDEAYKRFDLLASPTTPSTAFRIGEKADDPLAMYLNDVCTIPTNLAGHAGISVPFGTGDDGMPVGVQLLGPAMSEEPMFRAAAVLEKEGGL